MKYQAKHIAKLRNEAQNRFDNLLYALHRPIDDQEFVEINGVGVRLAVDDFKVILAEIRRLK